MESKQLLWGIYVIIQGLVIFSRLYIAAHFPHQCFLGLFLGIIKVNWKEIGAN
jgi:glucose-6-phosphatase